MNKEQFDLIINRRNTNSKKWDLEGNGLIPFSIADMDFISPDEVIDAVTNRAKHGVYEYTYRSEDYYRSIINCVDKHYEWKNEQEEICHSPRIVTGLNLIIDLFTELGDGVIIQPPVYYPFLNSIKNNKRNIVYNNLVYNNETYEMDFVDLENKIIESDAALLFLCNPHNPVGRVCTKEELELLEIGRA